MSDPAEVIKAVVAKLDADATLLALVPAGAYRNVAPAEVQKAVIVELVIHQDVYAMRSVAYDKTFVRVKAVERSKSTTGVDAAAARIQDVLQDQALTITGYRHRSTRRMEHIAEVETDDDDPEEHWQMAGGIYEIWAVPTPS